MSNSAKISKIQAREIIDSRGNPTLEAEVFLDNGQMARASVPSGASTGSREALELRDGDPERYLGKGVQKAVENVLEIIAPKLIGHDINQPQQIDRIMLELDGTEFKETLGANAILGVSMAAHRAAALFEEISLYDLLKDLYYHHHFHTDGMISRRGTTLPTPLMNILNGGEHADNDLSIQEFMIMPVSKASFRENLRMGIEVFHHLKKVLQSNGLATNVGDEGGFAPDLKSNEQTFELILKAITNAGYVPGKDIYLALDAAASEFYSNGKYEMSGAPNPTMNAQEMCSYYAEICEKYPIISIEDGLAELDNEGWQHMTKELGAKVNLVGDDLFVTNAKILAKGIEDKMANSILIKLNQIGSVTETLETIALAHKNHYNTIISHRSGETGDSFLADLAVATDAGLVKTGSASRGERMVKYNQLLRIEEELDSKAVYAGLSALNQKA